MNQLVRSQISSNPQQNLFLSNNTASKIFGSINQPLQNSVTGFNEQVNEIQNISMILRKPAPTRTSTDRKILLNFIQNNDALKQMSDKISLEFVKSILNHGHIFDIQSERILYNEGKIINKLGILLSGRLGFTYKSQQVNLCNQSQIWDKLMSQASKIHTIQDVNLNVFKISQKQDLLQQQFIQSTLQPKEYLTAQNHFGFHQKAQGQFHKKTCFTVENCTIFMIATQKMLQLLNLAMRLKYKQLYSIVSQLKYFQYLQQKQISQIIQAMEFKKGVKGTTIYSQGDRSDQLYFLLQGEIKLFRNTQLMKQDPNQLYMNRKKLLADYMFEQVKHLNHHKKLIINKSIEKAQLPYANLQNMYNFIPSSKDIQIATLNGFTIFGQQEFVTDKFRQTTAICSSLSCQYYQISFIKLLEILSKNQKIFQERVKESVRDKVLSRQANLSKTLNVENRTHMNYFYIENGKQTQSPRKVRIKKINDHITQINREQTDQFQTIKIASRNKSPPNYTTFNFQQMLQNNKIRSHKKNKPKSSRPKELHTPQQLQIMQTAHTWKLVKARVSAQKQTLQKISKRSPQKHKITFQKPLFERKYLDAYQKQKKIIDIYEMKKMGPPPEGFKILNKTIN